MTPPWPVVALGDIFDIARGGSPRPIDQYITDEPDGINWVTIGDASAETKYITKTRRKIKPSGVARSRMVACGDFLLTNSMSFGRPYIMRTSGCIHDGWLVLSPRNGNVDHDYFYHLLGSDKVYQSFEQLAAGAAVKNLNIDLVSGVKVSLPPLPEQRRIAAILDQADALRAKRRAALAQLDEMAQAIFVEMFGDLYIDRKVAAKIELSEICIQITDGEHLTPNRQQDGIRLLSARNVRFASLDFTNVDYISETEYDRVSRRCAPRRGDLLLSCSGTIGRVAAIRSDERLALVRSVALVKPNHKLVATDYLEAYLLTPYMQQKMQQAANASGQPNLFQNKIRRLPIMLPPMHLQIIFSTKLSAVRQLRVNQQRAKSAGQHLFDSLQHRAFRAEL